MREKKREREMLKTFGGCWEIRKHVRVCVCVCANGPLLVVAAKREREREIVKERISVRSFVRLVVL